jgi:ribosomal protein L11 methyltransferase
VSDSAVIRVTVLTVPRDDAELAADRMMMAGAFAVEERDVVGAPSAETVELRGSLADALPVAVERLGALPPGWTVRIDEVDAAPSEAWRAHAAPVRVTDDLVIRPAWTEPIDEPGVVEIAIEPGAAFGLGDHPTTRLSSSAVRRCVGRGDTVLDVGCGTGVLAIVALRFGAAVAVGVDIAAAAVPVSRENAERNGVGDRLDVSTRTLAQIDGPFDLVLANILAPALVALADDLRRLTGPDGRLVISGILADRHDHVLAALAPMRAVRTDVLDGWAAVELVHAS